MSKRVILTIKGRETSNMWDSQQDYKLSNWHGDLFHVGYVFHSSLGSGKENQRGQEEGGQGIEAERRQQY